MSYTPTNWSTGDTITASDMNKLENAVANAGSVLICNSTYSSEKADYVLDKTVQEIYDAWLAGVPAYIKFNYGDLGASGTGSYVSQSVLAPIIHIYGYSYDENIRITASRPIQRTSTGSNKGYIFTPSLIIYSASGMNDYPKRYASVNVTANSEEVDNTYT